MHARLLSIGGAALACLLLGAPAQAADLRAMVREVAIEHGVPVALAQGVARTETNYNCAAVGLVGELGIMQVRPATARQVGIRGNLRDCRTGAVAGMRYLRAALAISHGNWMLAATRYNAGLATRRRVSDYGRRVLSAARIRIAAH